MARRQRKGIDLVAALPWPVGIVLGILAFLGIRHGVAWYFSSSSSPITQQLGQELAKGQLTVFAWMALGICWIGALFSYLGDRKRKQLLAAQTGIDSLRAMSWQQFELLVGEAYRQRGYVVEETGQGGADGGVDLILYKDGRRELVQCKQWRKAQVGVTTVREMWGLVTHHGAVAAKIVCVGGFTADASAFARGKAIELVTGERLMELVLEVQAATRALAASAAAPVPMQVSKTAVVPTGEMNCPTCSSSMVLRRNRATGQPFFGCTHFPRCRGVRQVQGAA